MKLEKIIFICIWIINIAWILLNECNCFPSFICLDENHSIYFTNIISLITAYGGAYIGCKFLFFNYIKNNILTSENPQKAFEKWVRIRLIIVFFSIMPSSVIYYLSYQNNALYSMIIASIASLFCWPVKFEEYEEKYTNQP